MKTRFGDGGVDGFGGVVRAEMPVGEARALRRKMRERRHDHGRVGSADAVGDRHQLQLAELRCGCADWSWIRARRARPSRPDPRPARTGESSAAGSRRCDGTARTSPPVRCIVMCAPSLASLASAALIHARRRGIAARRRGRRPGRTTCVRAPSGRRKGGALLGLRTQSSAALRIRAAGSAATCRCRAGRRDVRACPAAAAGSRSRRHLKNVEREAMPNNLSCSATLRPQRFGDVGEGPQSRAAQRPRDPTCRTSGSAVVLAIVQTHSVLQKSIYGLYTPDIHIDTFSSLHASATAQTQGTFLSRNGAKFVALAPKMCATPAQNAANSLIQKDSVTGTANALRPRLKPLPEDL